MVQNLPSPNRCLLAPSHLASPAFCHRGLPLPGFHISDPWAGILLRGWPLHGASAICRYPVYQSCFSPELCSISLCGYTMLMAMGTLSFCVDVCFHFFGQILRSRTLGFIVNVCLSTPRNYKPFVLSPPMPAPQGPEWCSLPSSLTKTRHFWTHILQSTLLIWQLYIATQHTFILVVYYSPWSIKSIYKICKMNTPCKATVATPFPWRICSKTPNGFLKP